MKTPQILTLGVLALGLVGGGTMLWLGGGDISGQATGSAHGADKVWQQLQSYEDSFLREWKSEFGGETPEAIDVLTAFNELGYAITGPGGLWRQKVNNQWLGCQNDPTTPACQKMKTAETDFARWDEFQRQIDDLEEREARRFLAKHQKEIMSYFKTYVPADKSSSSVENTGFFSSELRTAIGR